MAKVTASDTIKPMPTKASRGMRLIVVAIVSNFIPTLYQIHGRCAAGVVTTKYTKYTKHGPVAGPRLFHGAFSLWALILPDVKGLGGDDRPDALGLLDLGGKVYVTLRVGSIGPWW